LKGKTEEKQQSGEEGGIYGRDYGKAGIGSI